MWLFSCGCNFSSEILNYCAIKQHIYLAPLSQNKDLIKNSACDSRDVSNKSVLQHSRVISVVERHKMIILLLPFRLQEFTTIVKCIDSSGVTSEVDHFTLSYGRILTFHISTALEVKFP